MATNIAVYMYVGFCLIQTSAVCCSQCKGSIFFEQRHSWFFWGLASLHCSAFLPCWKDTQLSGILPSCFHWLTGQHVQLVRICTDFKLASTFQVFNVVQKGKIKAPTHVVTLNSITVSVLYSIIMIFITELLWPFKPEPFLLSLLVFGINCGV